MEINCEIDYIVLEKKIRNVTIRKSKQNSFELVIESYCEENKISFLK